MGTWGVSAFDNDDACDWAYELEMAADFGLIEAALNDVIAAEDGVDPWAASVALAACEVIARANGGGGIKDSYTEIADTWVDKHKLKPTASLIERAHRAITRVLGEDSELRAGWDESGNAAEWRAAVEDLRRRLGQSPR